MNCKGGDFSVFLQRVLTFIFVFAITTFGQIRLAGNFAAARAAEVREMNVPPAPAEPLFLPAVSYGPAGAGALALAVGDLNGDGYPDVVVAGACATVCQDPAVTVFLGKGDGTFADPVSYDSEALIEYAVAIADVNGDGHPDIVIVDTCIAGETHCGTAQAADGNVGVLIGRGDGTFQPVVLYDAGGEYTNSLAVADVNRDGKPDVIVTNWDTRYKGSNAVGVLLGNGDGTFQPVAPYNSGGCGLETFGVAAADVNDDGNPDLMVVNANGDDTLCGDGTIGVLLGNGDGTFRPASIYSAGGGLTSSIAVVDVNRDGRPDLVVGNFCAVLCSYDGSVGVLLGNGDGTFQAAATYDSGGYGLQSVAVADVNGDGNADVLVSNRCDFACKKGGVGYLQGIGDGTFKRVAGFDVVHYDEALTVADVNGDGRPDVLVVNSCAGCGLEPLRVLVNNPAVVFPTVTALSSSLNPSVLGQPVTFTAQVTSKKGVIKDDELVSFFDGKKELGAVPISNGHASYTTSSLSATTHNIKAVYDGDEWCKQSTGYVKQVVSK